MALSEEKRAYHREWYHKNKDRRREINKEISSRSYHKNKQRRADDEHYKQLRRKHQIKSYYGLTWDEYNALPQHCQICGSIEKLHVDHSHLTKKVRGRLCGKCNMGIGLFNDDADLLLKAVNYLKETTQ